MQGVEVVIPGRPRAYAGEPGIHNQIVSMDSGFVLRTPRNDVDYTIRLLSPSNSMLQNPPPW